MKKYIIVVFFTTTMVAMEEKEPKNISSVSMIRRLRSGKPWWAHPTWKKLLRSSKPWWSRGSWTSPIDIQKAKSIFQKYQKDNQEEWDKDPELSEKIIRHRDIMGPIFQDMNDMAKYGGEQEANEWKKHEKHYQDLMVKNEKQICDIHKILFVTLDMFTDNKIKNIILEIAFSEIEAIYFDKINFLKQCIVQNIVDYNELIYTVNMTLFKRHTKAFSDDIELCKKKIDRIGHDIKVAETALDNLYNIDENDKKTTQQSYQEKIQSLEATQNELKFLEQKLAYFSDEVLQFGQFPIPLPFYKSHTKKHHFKMIQKIKLFPMTKLNTAESLARE